MSRRPAAVSSEVRYRIEVKILRGCDSVLSECTLAYRDRPPSGKIAGCQQIVMMMSMLVRCFEARM